jgi:hypothetical protein
LRILNPRWLSPEKSNGKDMVQLAGTFIKKGVKYLNMSFHSTSLIPGATPFNKSKNDVEEFIKNIEIFIQYAFSNEFRFVSLEDALKDTIIQG